MKKRMLCAVLAAVLLLSGLPLPVHATHSALDYYIEENITATMTTLEKLEAICKFVAGFDYDPDVSTAEQMLSTGGGNSYACSQILLAFCEKLNLNAWLRNSERDGNGSQVNVLVSADGVYYQLETGFRDEVPRPYEITRRSSLFSYSFTDGGICVYQYDGKLSGGATLTVPQTIDGHTVVAIGERFLAAQSGVQKVILPDTVVSIGDDAFNACSDLVSLNIPSKVTQIGQRAFAACNKLKNLTCASSRFRLEDFILYTSDMTQVVAAPYCKAAILPESVTTVRPYAFHCSSNLEAVMLPKSVRTIGEGAFADCPSLNMITFQGTQPELADFLFFAVTADAYASWTCSENVGGELTWHGYTPSAKFSAAVDQNANVVSLDVNVYGSGRVLVPMKLTNITLNITMESDEAVLEVLQETPGGGYVFQKQEGKNWVTVNQTAVTETGITLVLTQDCTLRVLDNSLSFPDVTNGYWAKSSIDYMTARGLMSGKLDGTFGGSEPIQRRTVAMMLWRLAGSPSVTGDCPFTDVEEDRYYNAIVWAYRNNIISGYSDGTFRSTAIISRQHFAAMLHRYAVWAGADLETGNNGNIRNFSDYSSMNANMRDHIQWALDTGLIFGRSSTLYDPTGDASRAQMAVILARFLKKFYSA